MTVVVDLQPAPPAEVDADMVTCVVVDLAAGEATALDADTLAAVTLDLAASGDVTDLDTDVALAPVAVDASAGSTIDLVPGVTTVVELAVEGCVGPPGPPGPGGEGLAYTHSQAVAATVWTIPHPIPYPPAVTFVDSAGAVLYGDLVYVDAVTVEGTFSWPVAGYAYLS